MTAIDHLMAELDERHVAQLIGSRHDGFRVRYPVRQNTVGDFSEYEHMIGDYYNQHFGACVANGGALTRSDATSRAKEVIEREYRRRNGDIVSAFNDARDGTNGGLRTQLDMICDALKNESLQRHVRDAFDRHVRPNAWPEKVAIIRSLIARFGSLLGPAIQADQPERYAHDYHNLVESLVQALQRTAASFRRL